MGALVFPIIPIQAVCCNMSLRLMVHLCGFYWDLVYLCVFCINIVLELVLIAMMALVTSLLALWKV
jgi:hypothetical protein